MYRPAGYEDSDEEDLDDYYYFTSNYKPQSNQNNAAAQELQKPTEDYDSQLYNAVLDGKLEEVKRILQLDEPIRSGACMRQGWPILFYSCYEAEFEIVEYLIEEIGLDVNRTYNLQSALIVACSSQKPPELVYPVVRLLLEHGAIIGVLDRYGCSPLMHACKEGHLQVVKEIVGESSLLSVDNEGNTALFHAVNNNHYDIVKVLLRAGAQTHIINREGFTPRQCAINRNYMDIADLLPQEEDYYELPAKYTTYYNYRNFIHGEHEQDSPEYYPEIGMMLLGMNSEKEIRVFAEANMHMFDFLTVTDDRLREIGVKYPIKRKRILLGLYDFHRQPWSKNSLWTFSNDDAVDCYDVQEALENLLRQFIVIHSSLLYTKHLTASCAPGVFQDGMQRSRLLSKLESLRETIDLFESQMTEIHNLSSPKPVLHITNEESTAQGTGGKVFQIGLCLLLGTFAIYLKVKK